jgi:hypothetical protein
MPCGSSPQLPLLSLQASGSLEEPITPCGHDSPVRPSRLKHTYKVSSDEQCTLRKLDQQLLLHACSGAVRMRDVTRTR